MEYVSNIDEKEGLERSLWRKVGVAFESSDGSINVILDRLPLNGRFHIRGRRPKTGEEGSEALRERWPDIARERSGPKSDRGLKHRSEILPPDLGMNRVHHVAEAIQYRVLDRNRSGWGNDTDEGNGKGRGKQRRGEADQDEVRLQHH